MGYKAKFERRGVRRVVATKSTKSHKKLCAVVRYPSFVSFVADPTLRCCCYVNRNVVSTRFDQHFHPELLPELRDLCGCELSSCDM